MLGAGFRERRCNRPGITHLRNGAADGAGGRARTANRLALVELPVIGKEMGYVGGRLALVLGVAQVLRLESHGDDLSVDEVPAVALLIAALLAFMGGLAVQFDAEVIVLVEIVEVLVPGLLSDADLALRGRQRVRAFDAAGPLEFQPRRDALVREAKYQLDLFAAGVLLALGEPARIRSAVVRLSPIAAQTQLYFASKPRVTLRMSSTVSSIRVHRGVIAGWPVATMASERWTTTPGIFR